MEKGNVISLPIYKKLGVALLSKSNEDAEYYNHVTGKYQEHEWKFFQ